MARIEHKQFPHRDSFMVYSQSTGVMFVATKNTWVHQITSRRIDATAGNITLEGENPGESAVDILPLIAMTATDNVISTSDGELADEINQGDGVANTIYDLAAAEVSQGYDTPFVLKPGGILRLIISGGLVIVGVLLSEQPV